MAIPAQFRLNLSHFVMKRSAAWRTPRYHMPAFLAAIVHTSASTPKNNTECSVDPSVASNALRSSSRHLCQLFGCPPGLRPCPQVIFPSITRLGDCPSLCRVTAPAKNRRLQMVVSMVSHRVFLRACLRVRKGGVVGTLSALETNDSQEDLVRRSEPSEVLRAEGPRHTPLEQSPNYLGLQHMDLQTKWSGRPIIQLRAEPFEACPHETDPSFDFERELRACVDDAAKV